MAELSVDAEAFTTWITGVVPLTGPPRSPFMTAVEAVSFLARGAFLTRDDITAIVEAQIKAAGSVETVGMRRNTPWDLAEQKLFRSHVEGALTLLGRKAPHFGADPAANTEPLPNEFFAGDVTLRLFNGIHDRDHPDQVMYCDVKVLTREFTTAFPACGKTIQPIQVRSKKRRAPNRHDAQEFEQWASLLFKKRGYGPSREDAAQFAAERNVNRDWARSCLAGLPVELRRERGGGGAAKRLSKAHDAD
jgi:hypothetical protein